PATAAPVPPELAFKAEAPPPSRKNTPPTCSSFMENVWEQCKARNRAGMSRIGHAVLQLTFRSAALLLALSACLGASAETLRYKPVSRDAVEARLRKYNGNNKQREATLKQMFA